MDRLGLADELVKKGCGHHRLRLSPAVSVVTGRVVARKLTEI